MTEADTEESPTGTRTATVFIAARRAHTAVAVGIATVVVMIAPQTNLELARSCDLNTTQTPALIQCNLLQIQQCRLIAGINPLLTPTFTIMGIQL